MLISFSSEAQNSRGSGVWVSGSEVSTLRVIVSGLMREFDVSWLKNVGLVFGLYTLLISASWLSHPQLPNLFRCICLTSPNFLRSQDTFKIHSLYMQLISILRNIFYEENYSMQCLGCLGSALRSRRIQDVYIFSCNPAH